MNANEVIKNIIGFNENLFENTYNTLGVIWDKNQKIAEEALEKAAFLPEEVKSLNRRYLAAVKEAGENIREAVLKGNQHLRNHV
ncbi:MAG: hypothetical protein AB7E04_12675 [Desulfobacteraceae bacterium]|jgi:2-oxo-4-hydroxy-4-carboxy--5-ureidoimidazoline (OHCU) decarboxylase